MTIQQTVEIPAGRRVNVTLEAPAMPVILNFTPAAADKSGWRSLHGICKGKDTLDAFLERKHLIREQENAALERRLRERE